MNYLIAGAGFSGAVLARHLVETLDCKVTLLDERPHPAGNCHTSRDSATNVMVHHYGPHIFHTSREEVWAYLHRFTKFGPYVNRVKATNRQGVFSMPINLHTINQFFGKTFSPNEARAFVASLSDPSIKEPRNFEEQALKMIGRKLYDAFFHGYTCKQWGCDPRELPASILKRLPVRFNYDDNYYHCRHQGIPIDGYTAIVEKIIDHPAISLSLSTRFERGMERDYSHVFYTGPIDGYFGHEEGRLSYRTVTFERIDAEGDYQGVGAMNYTDRDVPHTRIHEHKHFTPWEEHDKTVAFREFSKETEPGDTPYYPKRLTADMKLLETYTRRACTESRTSFLGRLATYRYLDMDGVIAEALQFGAACTGAIRKGERIPVFLASTRLG